jgi:hypothetical protein
MNLGKRVVFFIRAFNDLDHFAPIAKLYLENGSKVRFLITDKSVSPEDFRIKLLLGYDNFSILQFSLFDLALVDKLTLTKKIYLKFILDGGAARSVLWTCLFVMAFPLLAWLYIYRLAMPNYIVVDWSTPSSRGFFQWSMFKFHSWLMRRCTFAIPHGVNIYRNDDVTNAYHTLSKSNGSVDYMRFSERNWYSAYVVQYSAKVDSWQRLGGKKLLALGSPRFFTDWRSALSMSLGVTDLVHSPDPTRKLSIVFFDHQKNYRIIKKSILKLLNEMAKRDNLSLVLKSSTRLDKSYYSESDVVELKKVGIQFSDENSIELIAKSDLVVNFGSSIVLEAIGQEKPFINPIFCHENKTYMDQLVPSASAFTIDEFFLKLDAQIDGRSWFDYCEARKFFDFVVYNGLDVQTLEHKWLSLLEY